MYFNKTHLTFLTLVIALVIFLLPNIALAFEFEKNPDDMSFYYLGQIFGPVGNLFNTNANDLLGNIFKVFNMAVLSLGSIVVMYTVIVSTIHTAHEGEAMGKKFGSLWVPIRAVTGLAVLLPTSSGYSLIQILMTGIVLQGIWAANGVYNVILDHALAGGSINQASKNIMDDNALTHCASVVFESAVCQAYLNDPLHQELVDNQPVTVHEDPSNPNILLVGVADSPSLEDICGRFSPSPPVKEAVDNDSTWIDQQKKAIQDTMDSISNVAHEAATFKAGETPTGQNVLGQIKENISAVVLATPAKSYAATNASEQKLQDVLKQAKLDGWLYAGSYYFQLIKPPGSSRTLVYSPPIGALPQLQSGNNSDLWSTINQKAKDYLQATQRGVSSDTRTELDIGSQDLGDFQNFFAPISEIGFMVIRGIENADPDPLVAFGTIGGILISSTEITWIVVMGLAAAMVLAGCWMSAVQSACAVITTMLAIIMPILIGLIVFFWTAGVTLALYIPLIPYLIFTFTALGWMMLVIETIVAAPIVALGVVTPAQDAMGRASPAVMLITNVFLRPSLMVIGFVAAAQLLLAAFHMINFSFIGSLKAAMGYMGLFGSIAIVALYVGVMTTVVNQVFSLIYVLPDKVIRWIGGHAEQSAVERAMGEAQRAAESGGKTGAEVMKHGASAVKKAGKMGAKKQKEEAEAQGEAGGGGAGLQMGPAGGPGAVPVATPVPAGAVAKAVGGPGGAGPVLRSAPGAAPATPPAAPPAGPGAEPEPEIKGGGGGGGGGGGKAD